MTACGLNESLDCLDDIHQGKFIIIYALAEAAMEKRFNNSLKAKDSWSTKTLAALIVDAKFGPDWSKLFVGLK